MKWAQEVNLQKSKETILKAWKEFAEIFGREYKPVESYRCEDARVLLFTMGSYSETAMTAIDKMRENGDCENVGLLRLRLWRPFPTEELREALKNTDILIILDRALSFGSAGGPVAMEIKSALYDVPKKPKIVNFVGGLGGRDITVAGFEEIVKKGIDIARNGSENEFEIFGVRE
jgi:pyruvate ferredoxin oxidoreductase alpha subunit